MRIGYDAKRAFTNFTGLGNYSRDTIRILSSFFKKNNYILYTPNNKLNDRLDFIKNQSNISIRSPQKLLDKIFSSYWRTKKILNDIEKDNIDIYHGLSHELPIGIEDTKIKTIVTIHDLIYLRYPNLFSSVDLKIYDKKFRSACERADKIIAVSKQTKKDIINYFSIDEQKIEVVYQGCNKAFKTSDYDNYELIKNKFSLFDEYLLYVGSIEKRKNLLTLLEALKDIPRKKLIIIGDGNNYKKKCVSFINNNNLNSRTLILSGLKIEEMATIYKHAEMLIYPSIFEGFGIPILEALYSKIPVITSKGGCFSEAGGPDSIYINPLSKKEILEAIKKIEGTPNLKEKMIENGLKYAENFSDENIANNLMKVYQAL
jgi:glycosyltransferase involved in cell wall biosynthesis